MADLPVNGKLLELASKYVTDQALADYLDVHRSTISRHIERIGAREAVSAVRHREEVVRPEEIPTIFRDYSDEATHYLYPLGDVHKGSPSHDRGLWRKWLAYVESRGNASLLGTGDFLNSALKDSKSESYDEKMTVGKAKRELRGELAPLAKAGRLDALCPGNHEDRIYRAVGDCPIQDVCDFLSVPYFDSAALFVFRVGKVEYEVYVRHGTGTGQALTNLAKSGRVIRADLYVTGHTHRQAVAIDDIFEREGRSVGRRKMYFLSSGSFLGYEKYAAVRGYPPSHMGAPRVYMNGKRKDLHISL